MRVHVLFLAFFICLLFACDRTTQKTNATTITTYSAEELVKNDELFEKISKQCEMGEIPLDSANCNNAEKAAMVRAF